MHLIQWCHHNIMFIVVERYWVVFSYGFNHVSLDGYQARPYSQYQ